MHEVGRLGIGQRSAKTQVDTVHNNVELPRGVTVRTFQAKEHELCRKYETTKSKLILTIKVKFLQ